MGLDKHIIAVAIGGFLFSSVIGAYIGYTWTHDPNESKIREGVKGFFASLLLYMLIAVCYYIGVLASAV